MYIFSLCIKKKKTLSGNVGDLNKTQTIAKKFLCLAEVEKLVYRSLADFLEISLKFALNLDGNLASGSQPFPLMTLIIK